MHWVGQEALLY